MEQRAAATAWGVGWNSSEDAVVSGEQGPKLGRVLEVSRLLALAMHRARAGA